MADLRLLESFCAVMTHGSVQRAALELGYAQSTLTLRIQQLEEQCSMRLFDRKGKRLVPTDAARMLFDRARHLLDQVQSLESDLADAAQGNAPSIRFGCVEPALTVHVVPVLATFARQYPKARVTVESSGNVTFAQRVADGAIDFAICAAAAMDARLSYTPLFEERIGVLMRSSDPLAEKSAITPHDLREQSLVFSESQCSYRAALQSSLYERGVNVSPTVEITSINARIRAVQCGMGVALLPANAVIDGAPDGTVFRLIEGAEARLSTGILRRADAPAPGHVLRALFELLQQKAKARTTAGLLSVS